MFTDGDQVCEQVINENLQLNELTEQGRSEFYNLKWGTQKFDLTEKNNNFDLILCADVIYNRLFTEPLLETIKLLLTNENSCLISNSSVRFNN